MIGQRFLESEAGFKVLFDCATISILVVDEKGYIELSNPCAEKLFGYFPDELKGKPIETLIPGNHRKKHFDHREHYFKNPKSRSMGGELELFAQKKNGEIFPVEISLGHYKVDSEKLAVAFVTDITAQVRAQKMVDEREAWFRSIAENSPTMIWVADEKKEYTYFNHTWLEFTGCDINHEKGLGWLDNVYPEDRSVMLEAFDLAYEKREPYITEFRLKRGDGEYRWIQQIAKPAYSPEYEFTGYIGSCTDVNDQRTTQEELELKVHQRTQELNDALDREKTVSEMKSRFVSMASHEFRTPLSIILSSVTLIDQYVGGVNKDERIGKHLQRIRTSINNLTEVLNDFLSIDKLEQGNVKLEFNALNISEFVQDLIANMQVLKKGEQRINLDVKGEDMVLLDANKFRHVLENLISNAIKYSSDGTEIDLHIQNDNGALEVMIQDHGIGIPEEEQVHLFNKFFRATNTGSVQGTGLGLTIVKRYVELMNGTITFKSKSGKGTNFTIKLPNIDYEENSIGH
ncbi:PAS domain-containing sensor histidine kinase [Fulvivirga sp. 29W222]|uniref:histidine kinase n=1 Tax=Fulvivirga marina TaxID=2494733 RepID=A0A937G2D7_9BACT|nr:PAS domain-containing sensor histidine kinase [Fulvivirga marina]MBL6448778.1 PAS domain-containing sensor histidine kinase [Fulvivirga marina]